MKKRLAVVILHYGSPELTTRLHRQLLDSDPDWGDLFVLDNNAPDPYPDAWERLPQNLYWAGALDYTLERMETEGFTHVWFLNNDLLFLNKPPILKNVWQRFQRLEKTIGPLGVYSPSTQRNPYHPQMVQDPEHQYRRACYVDGIAPLLSLACVKDIGGVKFSGNKYGYGVDVALTLAAHNAGWPVIIDHQIPIKHVYHSTARTINGFMDKASLAEETYMRQVLGDDWRSAVDAAKCEYTDHDKM